MTLRKFLMWYLGIILFVGTAAASGYQVLLHHRAQLAARATTEPSSAAASPGALAAADPAAEGVKLPEAAPSPAINRPSGLPAPPHRRTAATSPHWLPPLRGHLAAVPALRPHLAASGTSHVPYSYRLNDRRAAVPAIIRHPVQQPAAPTVVATLPQGPYGRPGPYVMPARPVWMYAQPPAPPISYYPYPGYPVYQTGYAYGYPRYQVPTGCIEPHYRVY